MVFGIQSDHIIELRIHIAVKSSYFGNFVHIVLGIFQEITGLSLTLIVKRITHRLLEEFYGWETLNPILLGKIFFNSGIDFSKHNWKTLTSGFLTGFLPISIYFFAVTTPGGKKFDKDVVILFKSILEVLGIKFDDITIFLKYFLWTSTDKYQTY